MSDIERMKRYIRRTKIDPKSRDLYTLRLSDIAALHDMPRFGLCDVICMAFDYGMAKGYRMAKKEDKERRFRK